METNKSRSDSTETPRLKSADAAVPEDAVEDMDGDSQQEGNAQSVRSAQQGFSDQEQAAQEESRQANGEPDRGDKGTRQDDELGDENTVGKSAETPDHSKWPFARRPVGQASSSDE